MILSRGFPRQHCFPLMVIGQRPTYGSSQNITIRQQKNIFSDFSAYLVDCPIALNELKKANLDSGKDENGQKEIIQCREQLRALPKTIMFQLVFYYNGYGPNLSSLRIFSPSCKTRIGKSDLTQLSSFQGNVYQYISHVKAPLILIYSCGEGLFKAKNETQKTS